MRAWQSDGYLIDAYKRGDLQRRATEQRQRQYDQLQPYREGKIQSYQEDKMRSVMMKVIKKQSHMLHDERKNKSILTAIAFVLGLMTLICWASPDHCQFVQSNSIEKDCWERHNHLNCSQIDRVNSRWKQCEQLKACLKDPTSYQSKREKQEWDIFFGEIFIILEDSRDRCWWACLISIGILLIVYFYKK